MVHVFYFSYVFLAGFLEDCLASSASDS